DYYCCSYTTNNIWVF
nr:immunoglobulin light chain junction region [Macaca mulatta]MOW16449.1 immunoglobulin light chain junction region [Macaca mulatta]